MAACGDRDCITSLGLRREGNRRAGLARENNVNGRV